MLVANAARAFFLGKRPPVRVTGNADRQGGRAYNLNLSWLRAEAVKAALVGEGVPSIAITVAGRGEEFPLVPTPDGISELQNRHVTIDFCSAHR